MGTEQQFIDEFIKEHGEYVRIPDSSFWQFIDGARLEVTSNGVGMSQEPLANEYQRCRHIELFFQIKLQQAIADFDRYRDKCLTSAKEAARWQSPALLPDTHEAVAELKRLRSTVVKTNKKYVKAQTMPSGLAQHKEFAAQLRSDGEAKALQFVADINSVQI